MATPNPIPRLRRPAYAREIIAARAAGSPLNLTCFVGRTAWDRAKQHHAGAPGNRLVVTIDPECSVEDYDFEFLAGETLTLSSLDFDLVLSQRLARRIASHGVRCVVLLHPAAPAQFFYGAAS